MEQLRSPARSLASRIAGAKRVDAILDARPPLTPQMMRQNDTCALKRAFT